VAERERVDRLEHKNPARPKTSPSRSTAEGHEGINTKGQVP